MNNGLCGSLFENGTINSIVSRKANENIPNEQSNQNVNEAAADQTNDQTNDQTDKIANRDLIVGGEQQNLPTSTTTTATTTATPKSVEKMPSKALVDGVKNRDVNSVKRLLAEVSGEGRNL